MNRTHRYVPTIVLVAALAAGGLAACDEDGPESTATTVGETTTSDTTVPDSTAPETTMADTTAESTSPGSTAAGAVAPGSSAPVECADEPTEEAAAGLVVGLTEDEAEAALDACGWTMRVAQRDGEDLAVTMDFRPQRVNVAVTDGEVTDVISIG